MNHNIQIIQNSNIKSVQLLLCEYEQKNKKAFFKANEISENCEDKAYNYK